METLKPVDVSEYYIKKIATGMSKYFWDNIFKDIFNILKDKNIDNSKDDLIQALKSGRIWYENGAFRTNKRFSNQIAKTLEEMGARYLRNAYYIERSELSFDIIKIIDVIKIKAIEKITRLELYLASLIPILDKLTVKDFIQLSVKQMFKKLEYDVIKSAQEKKIPVIELDLVLPKIELSKQKQKELQNYWIEQDKKAKHLRANILKSKTEEERQKAQEKLSEHQWKTYQNVPQVKFNIEELKLDKISENIANDYVSNMNYWIKKWEVKNIIQMRKEVANMIQKGVRIAEVSDYFQKKWKTAKNKALFLAVNESHLAGSVIKATMYQDLGCTQFKWGRSTSVEKRELHKEYYNKIFSFNDPPIIDEQLGIKGLPRQIWNCKCQMLPIVPSLAEKIKKREEIRNAKRNIFSSVRYKICNSKQRNNSAWRYRQFG